MMVCSSTLFITLVLSVAASASSLAFSSITPRSSLSSLSSAVVDEEQHVDRPLLRQFGNRINKRIENSKYGYNWKDSIVVDGYDAYTSKETIPCLNMQCDYNGNSKYNKYDDIASRGEIRKAYTASSSKVEQSEFGRSSGSGGTIIRLRGKEA